MVRLKFLLFALPVLGLWAAHLYLLSPLISERAVMEGRARLGAAPQAVAQSVLERRVELQRLALRTVGSAPALAFTSPGKSGKIEAPAADKMAALTTAIKDAAPAALRPALIIGVVNEVGQSVVHGDAEPSADAATLDLKTVAEAGADGMAQDAFGISHLFYSVALTVPERPEPRTVGHLVLGAPLMDATVAETVARDNGLSALALVQGGRLLQGGGPDKASLDAAVKQVRAGTDLTTVGGLSQLGPLSLPLLTHKDLRGGQAVLALTARKAIPTTPFEVIAVATLAPAMNALANYQRTALAALAALLFLTLVWTLLMGSSKAAQDDDEEANAEPVSQTAPSQLPQEGQGEGGGFLPLLQDAAPPAEASPDDFPFGAPPPQSSGSPSDDFRTTPGVRSPLMDEEPSPRTDSAAPLPDPGLFSAAPAPAPSNPFDFDNQPTRAYTLPPAGFGNGAAEDFNPDATRVAAIPDELLRQSARPSKPEMPAVSAPPPARPSGVAPPRVGPMAAAPATGDDPHFQDVFKEFIATRQSCGEPADGLTYEKFAIKLRKNKEQLIAKYNCRTVRFQVYVKEGKAALKATPVKD